MHYFCSRFIWGTNPKWSAHLYCIVLGLVLMQLSLFSETIAPWCELFDSNKIFIFDLISNLTTFKKNSYRKRKKIWAGKINNDAVMLKIRFRLKMALCWQSWNQSIYYYYKEIDKINSVRVKVYNRFASLTRSSSSEFWRQMKWMTSRQV